MNCHSKAGARFLSLYGGVVSPFGRKLRNTPKGSCASSHVGSVIQSPKDIESEGSTINAEVINKAALYIKTVLGNLSTKTEGL